jgi:phosphoglycerate kinase
MKATIRDIDVKGKKALVRVDFNVPLKEGKIRDDTRIRAALPTINYLLDQGAAVIFMSHLGRPDGQVKEELRLAPVGKRIAELLGRSVKVLGDCVGAEVEKEVAALRPGDVALLENLRFHAEEEANDGEFAKKLASLGDIYVNDAFGTAHRAHASTAGVAAFLPAVSGFLMEKEISVMGGILDKPERPFLAILGGAKVKDKIGVLKNLVEKCDSLIIGGGMAFTFLKVKGHGIGRSLLDPREDLAREIMEKAEKRGITFLLPVDVVVAAEPKEGTQARVVRADEIPDDMMGLDIGPESVKLFSTEIAKAKTVVWNGPMGVFEVPAFAKGTEAVAKALAESGALTCIGGGDSVAAVEKQGISDRITHISTGGGASLEFLEGLVLPGVAALMDKETAKR